VIEAAGGAGPKPPLIFLIERQNYFRLFGALIDEALRQGFAVECWHDHGQPSTGSRDYLYPAIENTPAFAHGRPDSRPYERIAEVAQRCRELGRVLLFSLAPPAWFPEFGKPPGTVWICLQHGQDIFLSNPLRSMLTADAILAMSPYWIEFALSHYRSRGQVAAEEEAAFRAKCRMVGFPEADSFPRLDPAILKRKFGLPAGKKILLYLPWDKNVDFGPWSEVFSFPFRPKRILRRLIGNPRFLPPFLRGWHERRVFRELKAFCRRQGALLVVKSRKKSMDGRHIREGADAYFLDLTDYPPTIVELIRIADLCVHYHSFATQELGAGGVPTICVHHDPFSDERKGFGPFPSLMREPNRNFFAWEGFARILTPPELFHRLRKGSFADLAASDRAGIEAYREVYLGRCDGEAGARALKAALLLAGPAAARPDDVRA
jgi:hypothetical protein